MEEGAWKINRGTDIRQRNGGMGGNRQYKQGEIQQSRREGRTQRGARWMDSRGVGGKACRPSISISPHHWMALRPLTD